MKKLTVTMTLEMTVPDGWTLHTTSEGTDVLRLPDGTYLDLTFEPMQAENPEEHWASPDDETLLDEMMEMVDSEEVTYTLETMS